jgi:outer membrane lipoprotein-sorting protein
MSYEFVVEVSSGPTIPPKPNGLIRGWYEAPYKTRWEIGPTDAGKAQTRIFLVTENEMWLYEPDNQTYFGSNDGSSPSFAGRPFPLISNLLIGEILPESYVDDAVLQAAPRERMLGRVVAVLGEPRQGPAPRDLERYISLWVDLEYRLVMRERTDLASGSYDARMVKLSLNQDVEDKVFQFDPPPGAQEAQPQPTPASTRFPVEPVQSRFLKPAYVPSGLVLTEARSSVGRNGESQESTYTGRSGGMVLKQETIQGEGLLLLGTPVPIGESEGTYSERGGEIVLNWIRGDLRLTLRSDSFPLTELLRVAESMQ